MDEIAVLHRQIQYSIMSPLPVPPYVGPGDIVTTGWVTWIGLRAFSSATKGTAAIRVRRTSDNAEKDFATLSNGKLDVDSAYIPGTIVKFYDQSGNARDLVQATAANQAAINTAGIGSLPTADFTAANSQSYTSTGTTITQSSPRSFVAVVNFPSGAQCIWAGSDGISNAALLINFDAANTVTNFSGADLFVACSSNAWHSLVAAVYDLTGSSTSGDMNVDGVQNLGNSGVGAAFTADNVVLGNFGGGSLFNGKFVEGGFSSLGLTGTQSADLDTNESAFWGY